MVMALMRGKDEYSIAKIIDVRRVAEKDEEYQQMERAILGGSNINGVDEDKKEDDVEMKGDETQEKKDKFEYYVHYEALQRRNDRWVKEEDIKIDPEEIKR